MIFNSKSFHKAAGKRAAFADVPCEALGGTVRLARLSAKAAMKLGKRYESVPKDERGQPRDDGAIADFYIWLLSLSIVDEEGEQFLLGDEGQATLATLLTIEELVLLGNEAMVLNGMAESADRKKKPKKRGTSPTPNTDSPSS